MNIKPIETEYNGTLFRSRIEARWAVFMDTLDIRYEYEKEGYDFGVDGYYLPDFWLPDLGVWVEIKGQVPTVFECGLCERLCALGKPAFVLWGVIGGHEGYGWKMVGGEVKHGKARWAECGNCGGISLAPVRGCGCKGSVLMADTGRLVEAFDMGRNARFEHGQRGGRVSKIRERSA